jgi:YHS domain-containing protein
MKRTCSLILIALFATLALFPASAHADPDKTVKPYPLNTCAVCGMKLGEIEKPYVFVYEGREIKVCDKGEAADFKKDPKKYLDKIDKAAAAKDAGKK